MPDANALQNPSLDQLMRPHSPEPKTWGETWPVIETDRYARYGLRCVAGGYSSLHYHRERANRFLVERGAIIVWVIYGNTYQESTPVTDGGVFEVPSHVVHGFGVLEDAQVIEEYWADRGGIVKREDIVRISHGGRVDQIADLHDLPRKILAQPLQP